MNYEQAIELIVTKQEVKNELRLHGADFKDFVLDYGNFETYKGKDVLKWLGY